MSEQGQWMRATTPRAERGPLMAIGGAEDRVKERIILRHFVQLAGGAAARIAIIPTASSIEDAGQRYKAIFLALGAASAEVAYVADRAAALDRATAAPLADATGIFIGGGNQMRLAAILGGTPIEAAIHARHAAGAVIAGTSAGASILSRHMVAMGSSGTAPRSRMAQLAAGFGLIDTAIVDQHFRQRNRIGRLLSLVALNPAQLGLGVDEDTAAIITADGEMTILGRGTVIVVDGQRMSSDSAGQADGRPLNITDVTLHALANGARYDLHTRRPVFIPAPPVDEDPIMQAERRALYQAVLVADDGG
ncbi:MAG TPA: cyanophycinase [Thermomicrobiales bacterium]|jgi:cyanophycinase